MERKKSIDRGAGRLRYGAGRGTHTFVVLGGNCLLQDIATWFLYFIIYSFVGWVYESIVESVQHRRWINRGFLSGPFIPIYGAGAVLALFCLQPFAAMNVFMLFFLAGTIDCTLEYFTSWVMEKLFHARWWDYSTWPLNLNGRVCGLGFAAFGVLSVLLLRFIHPFVAEKIALLSPTWLYLVAGVFVVWITWDTVVTTASILQLDQKLEQLQQAFNKTKEKYASQLSEIQEQIAARLKEQRGTAELRKKMAAKFEESEFNTESIRGLLYDPKHHEKRLLRAFPSLKSVEHEDALEHFKLTLRRDRKKKTKKTDQTQSS